MTNKNLIYAKELLKKLTLKEKVAQLSQTVSGYRGFKRNGEDFSFLPAFYDFLKNSKLSVNCPLSKASSFENTFS